MAASAPRRRGSGTLVFDGDCGFCTSSAKWVQRWLAPGTTIVAWQLTDLDQLGLTAAEATREVQYVDDQSRITGGAAAFARLLISCGGLLALGGRIMRLPVITSIAAAVYRTVADNRYRLPGGTPACRVSDEPSA
jgi:predicted DCC family thiol-disulfide oxidoreductase YuxK